MSSTANTSANSEIGSRPIFAMLLAIAVLEGFDLQAAGLAGAAVKSEFALSIGQLTAFLTAGTFGLLFGALIGGRLSDSVPRPRILAVSVACFGAFSLLTTLVSSSGGLFLVRFFTGIGIGGALPNLMAFAAERTPPTERRTRLTWLFAGVPIGGALASTVAFVEGTSHWRVLFIVGGVFPLLLSPVVSRLRDGPRQLSRRAETPAGFMLGKLFAGEQAVTTSLLWAAFISMQLTSHLLLNWLPLLMQRWGFDSAAAAQIQISYGAVGALGCLVIGFLLRKWAAHIVAFAVACWLVMMLIILGSIGRGLLLVAIVTGFTGTGMMACLALNYAAAPLAYPTNIRGTGVGTAVAMGRIGSIAGPLVGGFLMAHSGTLMSVMATMVPIVLLGTLCGAYVFVRIDSAEEISMASSESRGH